MVPSRCDDEDSAIATRTATEPIMSPSRTQRLCSFAIAALLTLATLGGIDELAQHPQGGQAQLAQHPGHAGD